MSFFFELFRTKLWLFLKLICTFQPFPCVSLRILAYPSVSLILLANCLRLLTFFLIFWHSILLLTTLLTTAYALFTFAYVSERILAPPPFFFGFVSAYEKNEHVHWTYHARIRKVFPCVPLRILTYPVTTTNELLTTAYVFWSPSHTRALTNSMWLGLYVFWIRTHTRALTNSMWPGL